MVRVRHTSGVTGTDPSWFRAEKNYPPPLLGLPPCSAERYGELCPLLAPIYFAYGDVLLRIVESKAEAMAEGGGGAAGGAADSDDEEENDDEDGDDKGASSGAGLAGVAESKSAAAGEDGEAVDGDDKEGEGEDSDNAAAYENLEVARILYKKLAEQARSSPSGSSSSSDASAGACASGAAAPATADSASAAAAKAAELKLARVHVRLGDSLSEDDKFGEALEEYKAALALRAGNLPRHHRAVAKALTNIGVCYLQQGSASGVDEGSRRTCLTQSLLHFKVRHAETAAA